MNPQKSGEGISARLLSKGSVTVECALALPLFFLALAMLIAFMNAIGLQVSASLELANRARRLSEAAYMVAGGAAEQSAYATDELNGESRQTAGNQAHDNGWIDLTQTKTYRFPVSLIPNAGIAIAVRARVYPWIGAPEGGLGGDGFAAGDGTEMVYVTENQEVYHTHADCTHLDLSVKTATLAEVAHLRNAYGQKYKPCNGFPKDYTGPVYLTEKGDCYYPSPFDHALVRHVKLVKASAVEGLPLCSRCAGRGGDHAAA
ncbi:MAG: hypothetical protein Q4B73_00145 [Lachnospiraceae bacterium]|nr:hypothetical protein [Lachnospiraceae bacterium]